MKPSVGFNAWPSFPRKPLLAALRMLKRKRGMASCWQDQREAPNSRISVPGSHHDERHVQSLYQSQGRRPSQLNRNNQEYEKNFEKEKLKRLKECIKTRNQVSSVKFDSNPNPAPPRPTPPPSFLGTHLPLQLKSMT